MSKEISCIYSFSIGSTKYLCLVMIERRVTPLNNRCTEVAEALVSGLFDSASL